MAMYARASSILLLLVIGSGPVRAWSEDDPWAAYRFLIGEWVADSGGRPDRGSGSFSLVEDLQGKVLVRRNHAELPGRSGGPAIIHDDLMVIYRGEDPKSKKAIYFDSEGHVIEYTVTPSADRQTLTFISDARPGAPRYRLTCTKSKGETVAIKFAIAPPGKPDAFQTYLEGSVRRKQPTDQGKK